MPAAVINLGDADVVAVTERQIRELCDIARQAPLLRARYCLHRGLEDCVHEMVIALARDVYIRPHRHHGKSESFHVLQGRLEVVFFDDTGAISRRVRLDAAGQWGARLYRMNRPLWHCVLVHSEVAVIHETTQGPFAPNDCDFAEWAPDGKDPAGAKAFVERLIASADVTECMGESL